MRRNQADLLLVSLVAFVAVAISAISGDSSNALRASLSLPLVLFLPGYALSAALLPDGRTGLAERVALSVGLSIAIAALGGLLLNLLPSGLTPGAWRLLLLGVTLTATAYALWRRRHERIAGPGPVVTQVSFREAALLSAAALLIGLALGVGALGVDPVNHGTTAQAPFTQLWAIPRQSGQQYVIQVGLSNLENQRVSYRVTLESGSRVLAEWPAVTLASGDSWQAQAALPLLLEQREITANAYRPGDTTPYRHVRLAAQGAGTQ
ncbi:MAG: DUF1616 domain-containing protein [Nitrososphaerales archaeon]